LWLWCGPCRQRKTTKVLNFDKIHEKQFQKQPSIVDKTKNPVSPCFPMSTNRPWWFIHPDSSIVIDLHRPPSERRSLRRRRLARKVRCRARSQAKMTFCLPGNG
jgi:hypothetical protein